MVRCGALACESASNSDPAPIVLEVFGTVGESAVFRESGSASKRDPLFSQNDC